MKTFISAIPIAVPQTRPAATLLSKISLFALLVFSMLTLPTHSAKAAEPFTEASVEEIMKVVAGHKGEIVILNVFASWCPPCVQEARTFAAFYKKFPPQKGVHLIGISLDDNKKDLSQFISDRNIKFPVFLAGQDFVDFYGVQSIPTLILFDKEGKVVEYVTGIASTDELTNFINKYN